MLKANGIEFHYREYTREPLSRAEVTKVLGLLGMKASQLLRKNDAAYKAAGITGTETEAALIDLIAAHPTLLQRPIGVKGDKAVVGRPPEALLDL